MDQTRMWLNHAKTVYRGRRELGLISQAELKAKLEEIDAQLAALDRETKSEPKP